MRQFINGVLLSILIALAIFVVIAIIFDIENNGMLAFERGSFTAMALSAVGIGLGFSLPSAVYSCKKLPYAIKIIIHMGTGCAVMLAIMFLSGWIPMTVDWWVLAINIGGAILTAILIWSGFFLYYRRLSQRINRKIKEKQND